MQDVDFTASFNGDAVGEMLVIVQKVASNPRTSAKGSQPQFVGLTQVVFDRTLMIDELYLLPNKASKGTIEISKVLARQYKPDRLFTFTETHF